MKIQSTTDYAVRILQYLHTVQSSENAQQQTAMSIAQAVGITYPRFIKLANLLKKNGLIKSAQGRAGGYRLGKSIDKINVYDVFLAVEGEEQIMTRLMDEDMTCTQDSKERHGWEQFLLRIQELTIHEMKMQSIRGLQTQRSERC